MPRGVANLPTRSPRFEPVPLIESLMDSSSISKPPLLCELRLFSTPKYMQNNGLSQSPRLMKTDENRLISR
jgi:hypothetical protein